MLKYRKIVLFTVNILQSESVTRDFLKSVKSRRAPFWYDDVKKVSALGRQKYLFKRFVAANKDSTEVGFLIDINLRNETRPIEMSVNKDGLDLGNFVIPDRPEKPTLARCTDDEITILVQDPNNKWVSKFYVDYWRMVDGPEKGTVRKEFAFSGPNTISATIKQLTPLTTYEYKVVYFTEFGVSPASKISQETTVPCSEPKNLRVDGVSETSFTVLWSAPVCGKVIQVDSYKITLKGI